MAIIELVRELVMSDMHNKFEKETYKLLKLSVKLLTKNAENRKKSAILIFFQPLLNLSEDCLLVACITNSKRIHGQFFKFWRPQGQIIDVKWEKSQ